MRAMILLAALLLAGCLEMPTPAGAPSPTAEPVTASPLPVVETSPTLPDADPTAETCTVTTGISNGALNLRAGAGIQYTVLAVLNEGETVTRTGQREGRWWQVVTEDQLEGWVNNDYCK